MIQNWFYLMLSIGAVFSLPILFETKKFKVGIEYDGSLPMKGGSDRFRHRNNYDPFFVTTTVEARKGFVITYVEITGTVDIYGDLDFKVVRGSTGSTQMTFQLVTNRTDFLSYSYISYGIREEQYKKVQADDFISVCFSKSLTTTSLPSSDRIVWKCALCIVLLPCRAHQVITLRTDTLLHPVEVCASHYICHPCWQQADCAAKHYSPTSTSRADSVHILKCFNCNIDMTMMRRHILNDDSLLTLIQEWVAPLSLANIVSIPLTNDGSSLWKNASVISTFIFLLLGILIKNV